jgi:hypothetical protein
LVNGITRFTSELLELVVDVEVVCVASVLADWELRPVSLTADATSSASPSCDNTAAKTRLVNFGFKRFDIFLPLWFFNVRQFTHRFLVRTSSFFLLPSSFFLLGYLSVGWAATNSHTNNKQWQFFQMDHLTFYLLFNMNEFSSTAAVTVTWTGGSLEYNNARLGVFLPAGRRGGKRRQTDTCPFVFLFFKAVNQKTVFPFSFRSFPFRSCTSCWTLLY